MAKEICLIHQTVRPPYVGIFTNIQCTCAEEEPVVHENALSLAWQVLNNVGFIRGIAARQLARLVLEEIETQPDDIPNLEAADLTRSHDEVDRWNIPNLEGRETMCLSDRLIMAHIFVAFIPAQEDPK